MFGFMRMLEQNKLIKVDIFNLKLIYAKPNSAASQKRSKFYKLRIKIKAENRKLYEIGQYR